MDKVLGNLVGLKSAQVAQLGRLYRRRVPSAQIFTYELAEQLSAIAKDIKRLVAVLLNRRGQVTHVVVGDAHSIQLPELKKREGSSRLSGWRAVLTHPNGGALSRNELVSLAMNRLDMLVAIDQGHGKRHDSEVWIAHLLPLADAEGNLSRVMEALSMKEALAFDLEEWLYELEREMGTGLGGSQVDGQVERAIAVGVQTQEHTDWQAKESILELEQLARTAGAVVLDKSIQKRTQPDKATHIGKGKVHELALRARELGATTLFVDSELSGSQASNLESATGLKIVDRTALILDIFAQRAQTREGKLQVELAQLKYLLPRLRGSSTHLSRLGGGIGTRGPGETKLESDRRRVDMRVAHLESEVEQIKLQRGAQRKSRKRRGAVQVALMGYTNAGKSTLLNTLTKAGVLAENKLFATLDPITRKLRLPSGEQVLLTDTVGFIQRLPTQLVAAFRATLEEVTDADLLVHVVDGSHPNAEEHIKAVLAILADLGASEKPIMTVFNKVDQVEDPAALERLKAQVAQPIEISALTGLGLVDLLAAIETDVRPLTEEAEKLEPVAHFAND